MKKTLAILESFKAKKPSGFNHVFSFAVGNGDSYPDEYIDRQMPDQVYRLIFEYTIGYLDRLPHDKKIHYRGVDLLWCFKKKLLNFIYFTELRYRIFKSLYAKMLPSEVFLEKLDSDGAYPDLLSILRLSPFAKTLQMCQLQQPLSADGETYHAPKQFSLKSLLFSCFPSRFLQKKDALAKVVFFADWSKAKNLVPELRGAGTLWYSSVFSPRMIRLSWKNDFTLFQSNFNWFSQQIYNRKAVFFVNEFEKINCFTTFALSDLNWLTLIKQRFSTILRTDLARLLFDIDQIHSFFSIHTEVVSALLDEDVAPIKNAFCQIAKQHRVQTAVESHGALGTMGGFLPLSANRIFVWGNAQKEKLERWGCPSEKIIVSGRSLYADYWKLDFSLKRIEILRSLGLYPTRKTILVGLMVFRKYRRRIFENAREQIVRDLFALIERQKDCQFIIKVKKKIDDNMSVFKDWVCKNRCEDRVKVITDHSSVELALCADIVISHNSTFAIDGLAMKKPVIVLREKGLEINEEYRKYGAFYCAESKDELFYYISGILQMQSSSSDDGRQLARRECLNEGEASPQKIICRWLLNPSGHNETGEL